MRRCPTVVLITVRDSDDSIHSLIATWYKRYETAKRMAFFYLTSMVISGFSNIIGWAFSLLDGSHGLEGWRYVLRSFLNVQH